MKNKINMTIGEVCDRLSICKLKAERTDLDVEEEMQALVRATEDYDNIVVYIDQLADINGSIWDLESDVRKGKEGILGLEEVGQRALKIRNYNSMRVKCKNTINSVYNEGFQEIKKEHASE